jgi:hypothetical protein
LASDLVTMMAALSLSTFLGIAGTRAILSAVVVLMGRDTPGQSIHNTSNEAL